MLKSSTDYHNVHLSNRNFLPLKKLSENFVLALGDNNGLFVVSESLNLYLRIKPEGYIPKSGLSLISALDHLDLRGKNVLDVGCGETAILAHYTLSRGANIVIGLDIDPASINHAEKCSNMSRYIQWRMLSFKDFIVNNDIALDIIVSNPPQMPMFFKKRQLLKDWHDSPGDTGREMIIEILNESAYRLIPGSQIFMLIFDFLGIDRSFNNSKSIFDIAKDLGFEPELIQSSPKEIRPGGETEKNIEWIKKIYPCYEFRKKQGGRDYFNMATVRFVKK